MKYTFSILFIFYINTFFSQSKIENLTNITLSKIYNEPQDGSCNSFITKQSADIISKKITDCDNLVLDLIDLKSNLKSRKSNNLCCSLSAIGCPSIEFMVTYQFNKLIDTLYFNNNKSEKLIIDWKLKKEFDDKNSDLSKILIQNKVFKKLIETNLDQIYLNSYEFIKLDSIDVKNLKINNKQFYKLNRIQIDSLIGSFDNYVEIEIDKIGILKNYKYYGYNQDSNNEYYFINDLPLDKIVIKKIEDKGNYYTTDELFNINGITFNDDEKLLINKFPNSTKYIENQKEYFKNENGDYTITVKIINRKGVIDFKLNNGKFKQIEIDFYYPKL